MPKKKEKDKPKMKKLEDRVYLDIGYTIYENKKSGELSYHTDFGDWRDTVLTGSSKRSLTIQMKKEIEMRLKLDPTKDKPEEKPEEPESKEDTTLDDMSEEELDELFNPDAYKDKTTPENVAKAMVEETMKEAEFDSDLGVAVLPEAPNSAEEVPPEIVDEQDWENEEPNEVYTPEPLTEEDIAAEKEVERLEEETVMGPADRGELESTKWEQTVSDALEEEVIEEIKSEELPKTLLKGEIKFVVVNGKFFGMVGTQTFVTIESNKFKFLAPSTFTNMRRGRTIRVMPLNILNTLPDFDFELLFRFLSFSETHTLAKSNNIFSVMPNRDSIIMKDGGQTFFDKNRFKAMFLIKDSSLFKFKDSESAGKMKYPRGKLEDVSDQIMFINDEYRYNKEAYGEAKKILEVRTVKTIIDPKVRLLAIITVDEKIGIVLAPMGETKEETEEDLEIDESELEELEEEE